MQPLSKLLHSPVPATPSPQQGYSGIVTVHKYGGTSLGDSERMRKVARRIARHVNTGEKLVVVASAMGQTTDQLVSLAHSLDARPPRQALDLLMMTGEQQAVALLSMAMHALGISARAFTGQQAGILTDSFSGEANILHINPQPLRQALNAVDVCLVAGFQGADAQGMLTTLGRGGSDTSAVALAAALGAEECSIFTDTEGIYTTDPHIVPHARKLQAISYDVMLAMAALGARVLHPRAVWYARQHRVVLHVRSSFSYSPGSYVCSKEELMRSENPVTGISLDDAHSRINLTNLPDTPGTAAAIFSKLAEASIPVDMIIQGIPGTGESEPSQKSARQQLAFVVPQDRRLETAEALDPLVTAMGAQLHTDDTIARLSVVGVAVGSNPHVAAQLFGSLAALGINIEMISTSEVRISAVIPAQQGKDALLALHDAFGLADD